MVDKEYWDITKAKGDIGEERFEMLLEKMGLKITDKAPKNKSFKKYDFEYETSRGHKRTAEIKTDSSSTGNLFIQVERDGKPSGIFLTEADFYIVYNVIDKLFYIIRSEDLREAIISNQYELKVNKKNIQEVVKGILIPKKDFIELPNASVKRGKVNSRKVSSSLDKPVSKRHPALPLTIRAEAGRGQRQKRREMRWTRRAEPEAKNL